MKGAWARVIAADAAAGHDWCEYGAAIIAAAPDAPQDYYSWDYVGYGHVWSTGPGFLSCVYVFNPVKGRGMLLQSIGEPRRQACVTKGP